MDSFEIDLDSESVWYDDAWMSRDDLARKIKAMIDAGEFTIARPSQALEALTKAMASARLLALRITPEMSDALNQASQHSGRAVGALVRDAINVMLAGAGVQPGAPLAQVPATPLSPEEAAGAVELTPKKTEATGTAPAAPEVEKRWFGG